MTAQQFEPATPRAILAHLGLFDRLEPTLDRFANRQQAFDWLHLGLTDIPVGQVLDLIRHSPTLLPPRTGHMGNWEEIGHGRAGMMDFNQAICSQGYGYPLIYCFNQTEDMALERGDWVYLPGSLIDHGKRTLLPLYTWDGQGLVERQREQPLFTPFVQTSLDGAQISLNSLHWQRMQQFQQFEFRLEAQSVWQHAELAKAIVQHLLEQAAIQPNARRAFQDILSHQVSLDGTMQRVAIQHEAQGYRMGAMFYSSAAELAEASMLPWLAVAEPASFFANIKRLPNQLPLCSHLLAGIFSAIFHTHYPSATVDRQTMCRPFNPHFHWGARDMAGYPPYRNGYIAEKSTTKSYRTMCQSIIDRFDEVDPMLLILLPAVIFALCPTNQHPHDAEALAALFEQVQQLEPNSDQASYQQAISQRVAVWLDHQRSALSAYWINRFAPRQGILHSQTLVSSRPVEPVGFRQLSFRQACMIVGALIHWLVPRPASA
ncbi:MAG: DUF6025 family protein [Chloroflexi bacterium]|nr:DUF6025 family protein [Chloroflexota bacterium]